MEQIDRTGEVYRDDRSHVFRSWSSQRGLSPLVVTGGSGSWFWDESGEKYLDFCSQRVNLNLGHQHAAITSAINRQAASLTTIAQTFASEPRSKAARLIAERAPGDLNKVFFTNSGTDAVEHAVRMARIHSGRQKIFAMHRSYHGSTGGSISLTGDPRRWGAEPGMPGVVRFFGPYLYRSSFYSTTEQEECDRAISHLEELLSYEGPQNVAAIILEPVVGSNGVLVPPDGYLVQVREICSRYGIVMICDEVMSGFGRCGEWFAVDRWKVVPDLITFAKGVNSGYVPLGGVIISDEVARTFWDRPFPGGGTYYGHPLACASAVASIEAFENESIVQRARDLEEMIGGRLRKLEDKHICVGEVRGLGCLWALELVQDPETREMLVPFNASGPDVEPMKVLERECRRRGLWVLTTSNRLFVCPPLNTTVEDVNLGLDIIDDALDAIDLLIS